MQIRKGRWFAAALLLVVAVLSPGQETPPRGAEMQGGVRQWRDAPGRNITFALSQALDTDGDGKLSSREIEVARDALTTLDANHDGALSAEEIGWPPRRFGGPSFGPGGGPPSFGGSRGQSGRARPSLAERVMSRDANADGRVTHAELPQSMHFLVRLADANGDGAIDAKEAERRFRQPGPDTATGSVKPPPGREKPDAQHAAP